MSGFEVAGLLLGAVPVVVSALDKYNDFLAVITRRKDQKDIRTRLLLERARLETSLQRLSLLQELPADLEPILTDMVENMEEAMESIMYNRPKEKEFGRTSGALRLQRLSHLNDSLEAACARLVESVPSTALRDYETTGSHLQHSPPTDVDPRSSGRGHNEPSERGKEDGSYLKELAESCSLLLRLHGTEDSEFAELFNRFELWKQGLESERFYEAIEQSIRDPRKDLGRDLELLLYQAMVYVGETIAQLWVADDHESPEMREALDEFGSISIRVRDVAQNLEPPRNADVDGSRDDLKAAAIRSLKLVIGSLRDCLPSIVSFSRTCMTLKDEIPAADDVAELLEASVQLLGPGSEALSRATAMAKVQPDKSSLVDIESINEVFNQQAICLEKWAEKHKSDIKIKLANKNPAKLASVADAVENIAFFLDQLPIVVDGEFGKASIPMKRGSPDSKSQETIGSVVKGIETSVQSLVALESQLEFVESPPSYEESVKNRVRIDITTLNITHVR